MHKYGYPGALGRHYHYTPGLYSRHSMLRGLPVIGKLLDKLPASAQSLGSRSGAVKLGSAIGAQVVANVANAALKGQVTALQGTKLGTVVEVAVDVAVWLLTTG